MKDGRWVEGDFSKKVKGEGGSLFLFLFSSSSSWEGLLSEGCTRRFLFFLPAVSHSFFLLFLSILFLFRSFFNYFPFPRFSLPFSFSLFSLLHSSLQRVCLGGGLETSKPRGVGSCGEGAKEEQEQQRTGREKNDQANQIKAEPTTCDGGGDDNDTTGGSGRQRKAERQDKKERHLTAGRQLTFL